MEQPPKIAVLIPEFPGQTHSFFWHEIQALRDLHGTDALIVSTRRARNPASHGWVNEADALQMLPLSLRDVVRVLIALPAAIPRLLRHQDFRGTLRRPSAWLSVILALRLAQVCRQRRLSHIHSHSCANSALVAAMCHRLTGIPYSLVLHGPLSFFGPDQRVKWQGARFAFVITETLRREVAQAFPDLVDKVSVVPMGVDTDLFVPNEHGSSAEDGFVWSCCGRLDWIKGHDVLITAVDAIRHSHPDIAFRVRIAGEDGEGGEGYRRELERLLRETDTSAQVELLGSLPQDAIIRELQASQGFVLASRNEALGVAYMEAMSCGLPVVGTHAGGVTELIRDGVDGLLVAPDDPQDLARAMLQVMTEPRLGSLLGETARDRVVRDFGSRRSADALADALHAPDAPL